MGLRIAVVGATGNVGRELLTILEERLFPADEVVAIASRESLGAEVSYGERTLRCKDLETFQFAGVDLCLMAAGPVVAKEWAPRIGALGCVVIDASDAWRMDPRVPLVTPEVNPDAVLGFEKLNIVASPGPAAAQLTVALKPLHERARIRRVVVSTYQSVSDAGKDALDELWTQTRAIFVNDEIVREHFTKQIAFNVIPQIDEIMEDGATREEWRLAAETKKILDPKIRLTATCVRVPVFVGHCEAATVEFEEPLTAEDARDLLREAPGIMVIDNREEEAFVTPVESVGEFATFVSRIREDSTVENGLSLWIVSDNLRKGTALNIVQIAELMHNRGLFKRLAAS